MKGEGMGRFSDLARLRPHGLWGARRAGAWWIITRRAVRGSWLRGAQPGRGLEKSSGTAGCGRHSQPTFPTWPGCVRSAFGARGAPAHGFLSGVFPLPSLNIPKDAKKIHIFLILYGIIESTAKIILILTWSGCADIGLSSAQDGKDSISPGYFTFSTVRLADVSSLGPVGRAR